MSDRRMDDDLPFEALSALADGEADVAEVARACASWRDDAKVRARWSDYHLIGDVMRSDELADASGSSHFLKSFRERLVQEPVVLAPAGLVARHQPSVVDIGVAAMPPAEPLRRRVWAGPMAVAACFVMVVGALVTNQGGLPPGSSLPANSLAQGTFPAADRTQAFAPSTSMEATWSGNGVTAASLAEGAAFPSAMGNDPAAAGASVWRDPQLEQALSARRVQGHGEQSFASPNGLTRNVLYEAP
ncbi:MAG: sigma-E factor negative regulatory protein [Aquabacterium sp.]|uniref:sigma-E factor negative regulatory protein n=1 Tax=Aquabacterium sp. TaxID=1872578 RepID=UPI00271BA384|nr:sigma-E factor negative regulatory protein [Aquabacterium sp.]MDO9003870.1 sigma-E factor negative regulatory protein [Aquabacterium sp.]